MPIKSVFMALLTTGARVSLAGDKVRIDGLDPVRISGSRKSRQAAGLDGQGRGSGCHGRGSCPVGRAAVHVCAGLHV